MITLIDVFLLGFLGVLVMLVNLLPNVLEKKFKIPAADPPKQTLLMETKKVNKPRTRTKRGK